MLAVASWPCSYGIAARSRRVDLLEAIADVVRDVVRLLLHVAVRLLGLAFLLHRLVVGGLADLLPDLAFHFVPVRHDDPFSRAADLGVCRLATVEPPTRVIYLDL